MIELHFIQLKIQVSINIWIHINTAVIVKKVTKIVIFFQIYNSLSRFESRPSILLRCKTLINFYQQSTLRLISGVFARKA